MSNYSFKVKAILDAATIQDQLTKLGANFKPINIDLAKSLNLNQVADQLNSATLASAKLNESGKVTATTIKSIGDSFDLIAKSTERGTDLNINFESSQKRAEKAAQAEADAFVKGAKAKQAEEEKMQKLWDANVTKQEKAAQNYIKYLQQQASEEQKLSNQEAVLRKQFDDRIASNAAGIQTLKVRMTGLTDEQLRLINAGERLNGIQSMTNVDQQAKAIRSLTADMNAASRGTNTFAATLQYMTERFVQIGIYVAIFRKLTSAIGDMIETVSSLDKSLVELRKVTDMTDSQLESFTKTAFEVGNAVARTGQEVIDAAAIFKRSGYEINESLDLSKVALTLLNVGDGIDGVSDAATTLISVLKGYNLEADKAMDVTSLINEVSNNASINFEDLAEGLTRTSAVFNQAGVSMGELSGLLTGAQEILQNIIFKIRYLKYSAYVQKCA